MQTTSSAPSTRLALAGMMIERRTRAGKMLLALKLLENEAWNEEALRKGRVNTPYDLVDMSQCARLLAHATGRAPEGFIPEPDAIALIPQAWIEDARIADFHGWRT
jgi:hypothetical protein